MTDIRCKLKYVHVTLQGINITSPEYWVNKFLRFRSNIIACISGVEKNIDKGYHVHTVIQFSTSLKFSRISFTKFLKDEIFNSLNFEGKTYKSDFINALGYVAKTGNYHQSGIFTYRNIPLSKETDIYKFQYEVKTKDDAFRYFTKCILESLHIDQFILKQSNRNDAIGRYLQSHPSITKELKRLEIHHKYNYQASLLKGFTLNKKDLKRKYINYLKIFPKLFIKHLPKDSNLILENDYDHFIEYDLKIINIIFSRLEESNKYKYNRPHKSLNLFIWSKMSSFGKTRFMNKLRSLVTAYKMPDDEYYTNYDNNSFQIILSDEAKDCLSYKTLPHLALLFAGEPVEFNRKLDTKLIKHDNPLIIMAANSSFDKIMLNKFKDKYDKKIFITRILDIEIKSRALLHFIIDKCIIAL